MQQKNLLLFFLVSLVIILGWTQFQNWMWPPKPRKPAQPEAILSKAQLEQVRRAVGGLLPAVGTGLGPGVVASLAAALPPPPKAKTPTPQPARRAPELITLGSDDPASPFDLKVVLTSQGAGVRDVVLNKFQEADRFGLPAVRADKTPRPLRLVPGGGEPSHLLLHYAQPEDPQPLDALAKEVWTVVRRPEAGSPPNGEQQAVFSCDLPDQGVRITKTYSLRPGSYHLDLAIKVQALPAATAGGGRPRPFRYQLTGAHGLPIEGEWYTTVYRNALIGTQERGGYHRYIEDVRQIEWWQGGDKVERTPDKKIRYAAVAVQFFASAVVVAEAAEQPTGRDDFIDRARATHEGGVMKGQIKRLERQRLVLSNAADRREYTFELSPTAAFTAAQAHLRDDSQVLVLWSYDGDRLIARDFLPESQTPPLVHEDITVRLRSEAFTVEPGGEVEHRFLLYHGPVKVRLLGQLGREGWFGAEDPLRVVEPGLVDRYETTLGLYTLTDYPSPGFFGSIGSLTGLTPLVILVTNFMHWLFWRLHHVVPVYALCIVGLTVIVRGLMFPISRRQAITSQQMQQKMQKLAPDLRKLKEKYKDDPHALMVAQQELYKRHGINPLATMGGCLLLLVQMPIFLGLYYALQENIFLRLASFAWIRNLAAPDMLFWWSQRIPYISMPGDQGGILFLGPYFNLLPVVAVALMLVQQKLMTPPPADEQQEMQQKMMKYMMIFFGLLFYRVASGLCIYFIASSLWGLAERRLLPKLPEAGEAAAPAPRPTASRGKPRAGRDSRADGAFQKLRDWWHEILEQARKK
ncbi:MAG: YidC/Oxa1 family insertase periplasmic-domain containing protein [Gemmataceae bacterium]|nr:YidC/Oxa1 family insertase periplasmic-domain containing protein [Gemmataceae bacterium]MDW8264803.1 YidC/Oxa1 family insertase periplasmic-domain containing protein [Gemmataceae bacterium]